MKQILSILLILVAPCLSLAGGDVIGGSSINESIWQPLETLCKQHSRDFFVNCSKDKGAKYLIGQFKYVANDPYVTSSDYLKVLTESVKVCEAVFERIGDYKNFCHPANGMKYVIDMTEHVMSENPKYFEGN